MLAYHDSLSIQRTLLSSEIPASIMGLASESKQLASWGHRLWRQRPPSPRPAEVPRPLGLNDGHRCLSRMGHSGGSTERYLHRAGHSSAGHPRRTVTDGFDT